MKTAIKGKNYESWVISLKHVSGLKGLANLLATQKRWEITHENGKKHKNDEFLVITLIHVSGLKVVINHGQ
jgi:hypothetical protein